MNKKRLCIFIITGGILFSGCVSGTANISSVPVEISSKPSRESVSVSSSTEAAQVDKDPFWDDTAVRMAYDRAEEWQRVYYDLVVAELDNMPWELELYFPQEGNPVIAVNYGRADSTQDYKYVAWHIRNGKAEVLLEGTARRLSFNRGDGTLSLVDSAAWQEENPDLWGEFLIESSGFQAYYGPDVSLALAAGFPAETGRPTMKRRVADFFLDSHQLLVPEGAPDWVGEYVKFMRTHHDAAYMTEEPDFWHHGTIKGMILYDTGSGSAPIMLATGGFFGEHYFLGSKGRYTVYGISGLNDATLYDDGQGHRVIRLASSYTDWHIMGPTGWDKLFGEGWTSAILPSTVYINGESAYFEAGEEEEAAQWLMPRRMQAFASNGIGDELAPCEGVVYELAATPATAYDDTEITPWAEVEQMLIDALCDFARRTGQMA